MGSGYFDTKVENLFGGVDVKLFNVVNVGQGSCMVIAPKDGARLITKS